jgi:ABC-type dipeptide/oligopeptide/nickel transport system permease subunit
MKAFLAMLRQSPLLLVGTVVVLTLVLVAVFAPWLAPYAPKATTGPSLASPSSAHWLGTNDAGSDILSRVIWGSREMLVVATTATAIVLVIGIAVGVAAGLRGGPVDMVLMRVTDVFLALPKFPLLIFIAALAGPSVTVAVLTIGLTAWPEVARIVRSQSLSLRERGYFAAARGFGAGPLYVIRRHLVPALGPLLISNLVYMAGQVVTITAILGFVGLADPVAVSWGAELNRALVNPRTTIGSVWLWWLLPPGLAVTLTILGFTFIGVGLEPEFNPRWSRTS